MDVFRRTFSSTHPLHTQAVAQAEEGAAVVEIVETQVSEDQTDHHDEGNQRAPTEGRFLDE